MTKTKKYIKFNEILYDVVWIVCVFINIFYTHATIMQLPNWKHVFFPESHIGFLMLEGLIPYLLSYIYIRRKNQILLIVFYFTTIYLWANIGYSRYFSIYLPITLYTEFNNLNGLLPNIIDAMEKTDNILFFTCILVTITYKRTILYTNKKPFFLPFIFTILTVSALIFHYHSVKLEHNHLTEHFKDINDQRNVWDIMLDKRRMLENTMPKTCTYYYGIGPSLIINYIEKKIGTPKINFNQQELKDIKNHMKASPYAMPNDTAKNLIFILVESFASFPISKFINGVEITPNINKLLSKSNYYFPNMVSQTLLGESSDGQFIYLTGLLPLKNTVTINEIRSDTIETFLSIIKKSRPNLYCQMIIPTLNNAWSQKSMCNKYGFDALYSKEQYQKKIDEEWLNDKQLFEFASENDKHLKEPFINIILTSSMHTPYNKSYETYSIRYPKEYSSELKHYLDNVHYMDKYLGEYLETLKKYSWYSNSTIIITADHKPNPSKLNAYNKHEFEKIPFIIIQNPTSQKGLHPISSAEIYQTSVFPTILDMFHADSKWKGVGKSIFMLDSLKQSPYELNRKNIEQIASEYLILSKYINYTKL